MSGDGFWCAAAGISRSENERTKFSEDFLKGWIIWNTDADGIKMVIVKMMKIGVLW